MLEVLEVLVVVPLRHPNRPRTLRHPNRPQTRRRPPRQARPDLRQWDHAGEAVLAIGCCQRDRYASCFSLITA